MPKAAPPIAEPLLDELFELIVARLEAALELSAGRDRIHDLGRLAILGAELRDLTASAALIAAEPRA